MTVLEQGVRELMQKLEETCTEMQQGAENHICEGGSKLIMLQLLQYYVEITPRRELLAVGDDRT
jgi:hydroxymethylpyrimidine pyrophosphatase-like HAD family hydrolase